MKFKSKSLISIILSIMMVMSMILVAIPANAAVIDSVPVGAGASSGIIPAGEYLYYDFTAVGNGQINYCGDKWKWTDVYYDVSSGIIEIKLTSDMNFNENASGRNSTLCKTFKGGWKDLKTTVPGNGQNMVVVAPDGKSYKWDTYSGSSTESTVATTEPTATTTTTPAKGEWFLIGGGGPGDNMFGNYDINNTDYPLSGTGTVLSRSVTFAKGSTYFRFHDKKNQYSLNTNVQEEIGDANHKKQLVVSSQALIFTTDSNQTVNICLDTSSKQVWYESATGPIEPTEGDFKIVDKTAANGKLTFSAPYKAAGTANADDEVTVTATPDDYFECTAISVSYKDTNKGTHSIEWNKTADNKFKFTVPSTLNKTEVKDQEITVKGTFTLTSSGKLDYVKAQGSGLYIDVAPTQNDTTATLIKWNNYYDKDHNTSRNPYTFYVPKNVDLTNAVIYNTTGSQITLGEKTINNNEKAEGVNLTVGDNTINGGSVNNVKVMQGSTNAMFLTTSNALPTQYNSTVSTTNFDKQDEAAKAYKEQVNYKGGSCKTMTNSGSSASFSSAMGLSSIKGRGNSSWKASAMNFGKYAFNMKLSSATNLFNMDTTEPTGSKSWCLLANNADESMLRNALTYQLADEIGLLYSPEFSFVDIYDNGEYMGSYLVTEKVDVGSSKLVKGKSFEDLNEDAVKAQGGTEINEELSENATYSFTDSKGNTRSNLSMRYATVGTNTDSSPFKYNTTGKYLLEFEISERVKDEPCYFVSPHGQNVVVKNPEYATKEQVEYIAGKFAAMEDIAFTTGATKAQLSTVMDVESFAKMYLIQEFSSNLDSASTSYYLTFDCSKNDANGNGAVFVANPVWDYDWAYGQYNNQVGKKVDVDGIQLDTTGTNSWVAKNKAMDDSKNKDKGRSLQSQLAGTNVAFKSVVRKVWEETNGFYDKIQNYYTANGQIDTWYKQIKDSVDMNETRWGFIKSNPIGGWGSVDTGLTHKAAVNSLNTWTSNRAAWLNEQFTTTDEYTRYTPDAPTIKAYAADGTTEISAVEAGSPFIIKVTSAIESNVTYRLYEGSSSAYLYEKSDGVFNVNATVAGTKTYTVKAVYGSTESEASSAVSVTVIAPADLEGVSLSVSNTSVNVNEEFTLTATADPVGVTGVTYTFYKDGVAIATDVTSNTYKTKLTDEVSADYTVKATANGITVESTTPVTVTATKVAQVHDFRVYFKCASAPAYKPSVSLDGATAVAMTQGTKLGKNYAGTLTFYWYYADFTSVDSAKTHTLTFTSRKTKLNATMTDNFSNSEYYLAVDNLMTGTEVVNLTGSLEHVRNFFHSATNMVYSGDGTDGTLGFTNINGTRYKMGAYIDENGIETFSIKSATTMQMLTAELTTVSHTQKAILDVNLDGKVDIKDATLMQRALVS